MVRRLLFCGLALALAGATVGAVPQERVNPNAATIAEFLKRVNAYVDREKALDAKLPHLPKQTTPAEVDAHERALGKLVQTARADAKQGDMFFPAMQRLVRTLLRPIMRGPGSQQIRAEILDKENKAGAPLKVNARYPDDVPLSTVPPQVLAALPKLPAPIEYRFIGLNLILLDPQAHLIVDYLPRSFH